MNGSATLIAAGVGAVFFAVGSVFYYQPSMIKIDPLDLLTPNSSKARAAVIRLLHKPASAEFTSLRTVEVDNAKYVCGAVNAKDRSDSYPGARAFVYTVSIDFARIDDDGQIASKHDAYRACPLSEEEERAKQEALVFTPRQLEMAKTIQKALPASDPSVLTNMSAQMSQTNSGNARPVATAQPGQAPGQSGSAGQQTSTTFKAASNIESDWRADQPPTAWPAFPPGHKLASSGTKVGKLNAIATAKDIENRWAKYKADPTNGRPSANEVNDALQGLMSVDPKTVEFPQAWAAFVRLRKIDREINA